MSSIPSGFLQKGIDEMRRHLYFSLSCGSRMSDDYYFTLVIDSIWYSYLMWKNQDTGNYYRKLRSCRDLAYGCRIRDIGYVTEDNTITIEMPNHRYVFFEGYAGDTLGGPADCEGIYPGDCIDGDYARISTRSFFKLLAYFDSHIDSVRPAVMEAIDEECRNFSMSQIMKQTLKVLMEPGLEDISYMYTARYDDNGGYVRIYLYDVLPPSGPYDVDERLIEVTFRYREMLENMEMFKNMLRIVHLTPEKYRNYSRWMREVPAYGQDIPQWSPVHQF